MEKRGQDSGHPLLDAGTNWYYAKAEIDFLLEEENRLSLRITPLNGGEIRDVEIALTGLPQRPARTTRIHLQIDMADLTTLRLNMEDFGFGEFFPATHQFWEKTISIGEKEKEAAPAAGTTAFAAGNSSVSASEPVVGNGGAVLAAEQDATACGIDDNVSSAVESAAMQPSVSE